MLAGLGFNVAGFITYGLAPTRLIFRAAIPIGGMGGLSATDAGFNDATSKVDRARPTAGNSRPHPWPGFHDWSGASAVFAGFIGAYRE
jgi:hypothetical protein